MFAGQLQEFEDWLCRPCFHVIFNDLFQIIFSFSENNMAVDVICKHLLESSCDHYPEGELSAGGN